MTKDAIEAMNEMYPLRCSKCGKMMIVVKIHEQVPGNRALSYLCPECGEEIENKIVPRRAV
jgi:predicted RNA-binding Zn-ribbon protein involved in translation (DUF1610 family)